MNLIKQFLFQHTGYPVKGGKRVQLNMFLKRINQIDITEKLKTTLMPILWVDEVINKKIKKSHIIAHQYTSDPKIRIPVLGFCFLELTRRELRFN